MTYRYYKPKGENAEPKNIFVYLGQDPQVYDEEPAHSCYCPIGQHGEISLDYLDKCEEITKEEYIKASMGLYTPEEYI